MNGTPVELLFARQNPMGFRPSLAPSLSPASDTMICINDEYADGRDMSWLWDVDFSLTLLETPAVAMVSRRAMQDAGALHLSNTIRCRWNSDQPRNSKRPSQRS